MFEQEDTGESPYKQNAPASRVTATQAAPEVDGGRHTQFSFLFEAPSDTCLTEVALNATGRIAAILAGGETLFAGSRRMFPDLASLRRPVGELVVKAAETIEVVVEGIREQHECRVTFEKPE